MVLLFEGIAFRLCLDARACSVSGSRASSAYKDSQAYGGF